jgi:hypothetical protein
MACVPFSLFTGIRESLSLYDRACQLQPSSSSYCLSYVHTLEIVQEFEASFQRLKTFLQQNPTLQVGSLTCQHVFPLVQDIHRLLDQSELQQAAAKPLPSIPPTSANVAFTPSELDLLALLFTLAKIAFVAGALPLIPPLKRLLGEWQFFSSSSSSSCSMSFQQSRCEKSATCI